MQRRGPDAEGYAEMGQAVFGFRRLAIRDLSGAANQPMLDPARRSMLVFNGELYHLDSLRSKLRPGTAFKTHSDTEVLLHCLVQLGVERTLPLLDGIFAFAWYDHASGTLTLARDRCGVKPLYYALNRHTVIFSSEYDLLLCHEEFRETTINPDALANYLRLGFIPDGEGLYTHTFLLPHGHYLTLQENSATTPQSYYHYPWQSGATLAQPIGTILEDSVNSQLVGDVPLGVFLSGGIDSSLVSVFASRRNSLLESFTVGVSDAKEMDESHEALSFAGFLRMKNNLKAIADTDVFSTLIQQNTDAFSEPFADYSSLPTLLLAQFARERITVALSGDGGDELFWGYPRHTSSAAYAPWFLKPDLVRQCGILWSRFLRKEPRVPLALLKYSDFSDFAYRKTFITGAKKWAHRIFPHSPTPPFFLQYAIDKTLERPPESVEEWMLVLRKIEFDFHLQRVLLKVDRASNYHSLEVRVPLLSNAMLEASSSYVHTDCLTEQQGKVPLRKLLAIHTPGLQVSQLPKKGFTVPIDAWTKELLHQSVNDRLRNIPRPLDSYFNPKAIEALLNSGRTEKSGWMAWALFTLFNWSEERLKNLREDYQRNPAKDTLRDDSPRNKSII